MTRPIIEVENISKCYRLGQFNARSLREEADRWFLRRRNCITNGDGSEFWALQDVSFTVQPGEVLGIIGRNGAGKSTLLKILSRVTEPTRGAARIRGRVASLLEVGTGFHPELTGRENIYLNGAILGMSRAEINAKFDQIVDFSGIETFLNTPVKRYSSGMYVRLAFAVAAHLEPEVLIVDEVLAVGDAEFQMRCLGKMREVSNREGRTVLFVSHNIGAVNALCGRAILMEKGSVAADGEVEPVTRDYILRNFQGADVDVKFLPRSGGLQQAIHDAWIEDAEGRRIEAIMPGRPFAICFRFKADHVLKRPRYGIGIEDFLGRRICSFSSNVITATAYPATSEGIIKCVVMENRLFPDMYSVSLAISDENETIDWVEGAFRFQIISASPFKTGRMYERSHGVVFLNCEISFEHERIEA